MAQLKIFATSRAIRESKSIFLEYNSLIEHTTTIGDFLNKAITVENRAFVDSNLRVLYLKEATKFDDFKFLKSDLNLIKFYSNSKEFFSFFEELAVEMIDINSLLIADTYAEFERDLDILEKLRDNYKNILDAKGLTDRAFIASNYKINWDYINSFERFELELEGFLTNFELMLFSKIAEQKEFIVKIRSLKFNEKVQKSFKTLGIDVPESSFVEFNLGSKEILSTTKVPLKFNAEVIKTQERFEQISIAFAKVQEFIDSGIEPKKVAIITPDESFARVIRDFDRLNNYNLAMGYEYRRYKSYIALNMLKEYLSGKMEARGYLQDLEVDLEKVNANEMLDALGFFEKLATLNLPLYSNSDFEKRANRLNITKRIFKFKRLFRDKFSFKDWLFLWISELSEHTIDDISGGKVTIMGVLESRGVDLDGVVIVDFNEGTVPTSPKKDRFLNTTVRSNASLPTKKDRENLQKYYYARVLERVKKGVILYHTSNNQVPSKFLYELGLDRKVVEYKAPNELLFTTKSQYIKDAHSVDLEFAFDARAFVWSATNLKVYLDCKRKFYYKYIAKISEPKSDDINEGAILHEVLSRVLVPNCSFKSDIELKKALDIELAKIKSPNVELLYKKALWSEMLDAFAKEQFRHLSSGWIVEAVEQKVRGKIGGLDFNGYIDRIDKKDNRLLVIDYKSGNINNTQNIDKMSDFQMSIYKLLLDKPIVDFAYLKILENQKLEFVQKQEEKEQKLLELLDELKKQKSLVAVRCENLQICRYCPYQLLCHRGEYL